MKYRKLEKSDIEISEIGFGTWAFSLPGWWGKKIDEDGARSMLKKAYDLGINFFEMACAISMGGFFNSLVSKSEILEDKSPNSGFFGGAKENSFSGNEREERAAEIASVSRSFRCFIAEFFYRRIGP